MVKMQENLSQKSCRPCEGEYLPLQRMDILEYLKDLPEWNVTEDDKRLYREFTMKGFLECVGFINKIAAIAEGEGHHPDLHLTDYKKIEVVLTTHAISGLSENDFIMAAKINEVQQ